MNHARAAIVVVLGQALTAQSFDDLTTFRSQTLPYSHVLQLEAGMIGSMASEDDTTAGLVDETKWDGRAWYHAGDFTGRSAELDAYAGRDGVLASLREGRIIGNDTTSRLQLSARPWQFYREGFYRGDSFIPTGRYEGRDWEGYLGFGRMAAEGLFVEFGPFYGRKTFRRSGDTAANYIVPDDFKNYGGRLFVEQNTVQLDRRTRMPRDGFLATIVAEREWNDSSGVLGVNSGFQTELPSAVWRGRGRLEWYIPQGANSAWEIFASGAFTDETDRVVDYEAQHPQGNLWVDAQLRLRLPFGDSVSLSPFVHGQFTRILVEDGSSADQKFFLGFGAEGWIHLGESVSVNAWYSWLDNESRPSISFDEDLHGQHMFWVGMVLRLGAK